MAPLPSPKGATRRDDGAQDGQAASLLAGLDEFALDLEAGALVVIGNDRIRVRGLPIE